MENNWEPRVGQEVASLVDGYGIKKGDIRTVLGVKKHCCDHWLIDVGLIAPFSTTFNCKTCKTALPIVQGLPLWPQSAVFAPVTHYPNHTSEIAQQFKEHPDTFDQPVKVLETQN